MQNLYTHNKNNYEYFYFFLLDINFYPSSSFALFPVGFNWVHCILEKTFFVNSFALVLRLRRHYIPFTLTPARICQIYEPNRIRLLNAPQSNKKHRVSAAKDHTKPTEIWKGGAQRMYHTLTRKHWMAVVVFCFRWFIFSGVLSLHKTCALSFRANFPDECLF